VAIRTDGTLWSWGNGAQGKLSQNNSTNYSSPKQIGSATTWSKIAAGTYNTAAITTSGALWICGLGTYGANGLGDTASPNFIQLVSATVWADISFGFRFALALRTNGTLWAWGGNTQGQLGRNNLTNYSSPVQIGALTTWSKISTAASYSFDGSQAIKADGTLWAWGDNFRGQLGFNNTYDYSSPKQVGALTTWAQVSAAPLSTRAIKTDGTLWTWGSNANGELGIGNKTYRSSPVQVGALTTWVSLPTGPVATTTPTIKTS